MKIDKNFALFGAIGAIILLLLIVGGFLAIKFRPPQTSTEPAPVAPVPLPPTLPTLPLPENTVPNGVPSSNTQPLLSSTFSYPYPLVWHEPGNVNALGTRPGATFSLTKARIENSAPRKLILTFTIKMDDYNDCLQCKPQDYPTAEIRLRRILDEQGNLAAPETSQFYLPHSGGSMGKWAVSYADQEVVFTIPAESDSFFFTTGGLSDVSFDITRGSGNSLVVKMLDGE